MLLSKLTDSDQLRSDRSALVTENENLKAERRELLQRLSEFEKTQEAMSHELLTQKEDIKTYLHNVSKLKEENDKKTREVNLLKETATKQKLELDHDLNRLENDSKRYEDQVSLLILLLDMGRFRKFSLYSSLLIVLQVRQLQLELSEKSHLENRMRSDLLAAETKMTHFESENMALRRRLADAMDSREREGAQFQIKISSLETEVNHLMDEIARIRRNQSSLGSAGGGYGGGYSTSATPLPSASSVSSYSVQSSYPSSSAHYPPSSYAPLPSSMPPYSNPSSSIGSLSDDRGHHDRGKGSQPRSLRGALEKDPNYYESSSGAGASHNPTSLASLVRGKGAGGGGVAASPFATEITSSQMKNFDDLERQLTSVMSEKTALEEELGR